MPGSNYQPSAQDLDLAARVRDTFPDPGWPEDKLAADDDGDLDCKFINENFRGKRWRDMTEHELSYAGMDAWAFYDETLAYFLPAYLVAELETGLEYFTTSAELWIPRLSPFRQWGYGKPQIELLLEICHHLSVGWYDADDPTWQERVLTPLESELDSWP